MKEVNFLEGCEALRDEKCKEIKDKDGNLYKLRDDAVVICVSDIGTGFDTDNILGEWKLIKIKKKIVIEDVGWAKSSDDGVVFPIKFSFDWHSLIKKPKMKMTLEWEE